MKVRVTLRSLTLTSVLPHSDNKRVSDSGFQPSPKSPSATSDTRNTLVEIPHAALNGGNKYPQTHLLQCINNTLRVSIKDLGTTLATINQDSFHLPISLIACRGVTPTALNASPSSKDKT